MRTAQLERNTKETKITLSLNIDGTGKGNIDTGCGFLDHMLTSFAKNSRYDLDVKCIGDTEVDYHHTTEDIGIVLGKAIATAVGDKKGIVRYGEATIPMDDALTLAALDISGRAYLGWDLAIPTQKVGDFDTELVKEFFYGVVRGAEITVHMIGLKGENSHHIIESAFKAFARSMRKATSIDEAFADDLPSTKGVL